MHTYPVYARSKDPLETGPRARVGTVENHKWLKCPLKILVRIPLEKQFDLLGPIASGERFIWPTMKDVDG